MDNQKYTQHLLNQESNINVKFTNSVCLFKDKISGKPLLREYCRMVCTALIHKLNMSSLFYLHQHQHHLSYFQNQLLLYNSDKINENLDANIWHRRLDHPNEHV